MQDKCANRRGQIPVSPRKSVSRELNAQRRYGKRDLQILMIQALRKSREMLLSGLSIALIVLGILNLCAPARGLSEKSAQSITVLNLAGRKLGADACEDLSFKIGARRVVGFMMIVTGLARLIWGS